jgi:signal transduction histidine kinase
VNDLVDFVKPFIQNDNVLILNNVPDDLIIQNWPDSLRVLLYNLIINGVNNTVHGKIEISYYLSNNGYKIIISDTGVGMNDSMVEYLLKGKNKNEVDDIPKLKTGNGVGFQIIRNIVQLMGAKFEIESIQNIGTKVTLIFNDQ